VLYFASSDVLLVDSLTDRVGDIERPRKLLAARPRIVRGCVPYRDGHRVLRQLAQKSILPLRYYWTLFVLAGLVLLLSELRMVRVTTALVWPLVFIGTGIAFLLERRHAKRLGYQAK
jgi:hypothetical protein